MYSIDHRDLGTPPAPSEESVTLEVDGATVTVPAGTSVMRAAALADTQISRSRAARASRPPARPPSRPA